jgi:CNT family concentrative nucleoside transporter
MTAMSINSPLMLAALVTAICRLRDLISGDKIPEKGIIAKGDKKMDIYNLVSFSGIFVLIGFAWVLSREKRNMNWRVIIWGVILQIIIALFIFIVPAGAKVFLFVNDIVIKVLESSTAGAKFVFGRLAIPPGQTGETGEEPLGIILAFQAFPTIIFFSALISILYYFNIMPLIVRGFAYIFTKLMRVSGTESLVTASSIFVGVEANLTVKPYLDRMTQSELCTILTAGMATIASSVLALYVFSLKDVFPMIAGHLVSASLLSAPAALVMSKIIFPENERPETLGVNVRPYYEKEKSFLEAVINGANAGVKMIVGIVALLIAVLGLVALVDLVLAALGAKVNPAFGFEGEWSLKAILGYIFYPFTLILGVPPSDAWTISKIIGERTIVTEVAAYKDLKDVLDKNLLQNPRSAVIAIYALCGFAHLTSMAIFVGGISALVPGKTGNIAKVAVRALLAAILACLLTACIAGTFFTKGSILLGG